jgi:glycine/D-amino acid oxidase-like deaminating enzyme
VKVRSKEPYWLLKNGLLNTYPSLRENIWCDVLIIGGGLTGALMAYQFASEGYKTVVIDKREVGTGSTCATTSMVQYEIDEPLYGLMDMIGKDAAIDIYKESVNCVKKLGEIVNDLHIPCGFAYKDSLHFANTVQDALGLEREIECRKVAGIKVKWLLKEEIKSRYGLNSEGGILSETAASMDAYQLTHGLMQFSIRMLGLEVYDHVTLRSVKYKDCKNIVTVHPMAQIECNHIVYATGYETHEMMGGKSKIGKLLSTYVCISEPFSSLHALEKTIFWNTEDPYFYFRTTADNRLLIGGADEGYQNAEMRDALIDAKEDELVYKIKQKIPGIDFVADFAWAGVFGATKDTLPYIGTHPDFPNSSFMLGFGGNGITFSVMGMKILSDALAGRQNRFLEYFRFER